MQKNKHISNRLITWYLRNKRDLPWRENKNPYSVWLSEIILQQTKIAQGTSYYLKFLSTFPTINHLANAKEATVLKLWQGLGYYSRARNLHFSAKKIMTDYAGEFPKNYKTLLTLKGVGDYTASAITSICYNQAHATVDGNVYRVLSRIFGIATPINSAKGAKEFKNLAQELLSLEDPGTHNQALMEFGALVCKPKNPDCINCIFNTQCIAFSKKLVNTLPVKEKKLKVKNRYFNFLVFNINNERTFVEQRKQKGIWQNLFQFPLIESEQLLEQEQVLKSELFQSFILKNNFDISLFNPTPILHKLTHQNLYTNFWIIDTDHHLKENILWRDLKNFALPTLIQNFVDNYKKRN